MLLNKPGDNIIFELGQPSTLTLDFGWYTEIYKIEFTDAQYKYLENLSEKDLQRKILSLLCLGKLKTTLVKKEDYDLGKH